MAGEAGCYDAPLGGLASREPVTVSPGDSVARAVELMAERNIGSVVVVTGGRVVGILTERDIVRKVLGRGAEPGGVRVAEVMTPYPVTLRPGDTLGRAIEVMADFGIRHVPLTDESGRPVGMVSVRDVVRALRECVRRSSRG